MRICLGLDSRRPAKKLTEKLKETIMAKQVQEAYIVAATRTPIGRSSRGYFRNMRPDDLLVKALQAATAHRFLRSTPKRLKTSSAAARSPKARKA
jgi:hypothetical protein